MRKGSEFASVPEDWRIEALSDVCSMQSGGTPPKSQPTLWTGDVPWVSGKDLKSSRLKDSIDHITQEAAERYSKIAPAGSVLVLVRGMALANGFALSLIERPMAFNQDLKALIPKGQNQGAFLMYALTFAGQRMLQNVADAAHGTKRLSQDDLNNFKLPIPSPEHQQLIAAALDKANAAVGVEMRAEAHARMVKSAVMHELFTHGLRGEPQRDTEIGNVPTTWKVIPFASIRERLQYGMSARCGEEPNGYPVLRIPNILAGQMNTGDLKYCELSDAEAESYLLEEGDLLFIRTNGVLDRLGSCAVYSGVPPRALFASYLIRARLKRELIEPRFLAFFYSSARGSDLVTGRATPAADGKYNLNTGTIDSLPVALPPPDEQREIVAILDAIDQKIAFHKRKGRVLEDLFKALLHKLMTGEICVSDLNLSALGSAAPPQEISS